jgi:CubicO group peptidase (beta-lactamase class C family)
VIEECGDLKYPQLLAEDVFELSAMFDSVPGGSVPLGGSGGGLGTARLDRYRDVLRRAAVPYHVVSRRAQRNVDFAGRVADAADGVVTTVRDLERFDVALDSGLLLEQATRALAFTQVLDGGVALPTGLGWFVQGYNGQPIVWQFGQIDGAYSSLIVKVPNRRLTFILLANSDGLSAPFALTTGDVTNSLFARLFLKSFVP